MANVIKTFIDEIRQTRDKAMIAILSYIDKEIDVLKNDRNTHRKDIKEIRGILKGLDDIQAKLDSDAKTRALIKKIVLTGVIGGIITALLNQVGILGG